MRDRIFQNSSTSDSQETYWKKDGTPIWEVDYVYQKSIVHDCMRDIDTSEFKRRSNAGEIILNAMAWEKVVICTNSFVSRVDAVGSDDGVYLGRNASTGYGGMDTLVYLPDNSSGFSDLFEPYSSLKDAAVAKAWANVDESEMQSLATLGELPETVQWMCSIMQRLIRLIKKLKRKKAKLLMQFLTKLISKKTYKDGLADCWLEFRYAVRPLFFDMRQAVAAFSKTLDKKSRRTARGYTDSQSTVVTPCTWDDQYVVTSWNREKNIQYSARAGVLYSLDEDINGVLAVFGLDQPLEAIWDLTPFSFILDWFFNIGDLIAGWSKNASLNALGSWVVERLSIKESTKTFDFTMKADISPYTELDYTVLQQSNATVERMCQQRTVDPARPLMPSFKLNLDLAKLIDLAAIARGLFRS